jgi:hypothetical protein
LTAVPLDFMWELFHDKTISRQGVFRRVGRPTLGLLCYLREDVLEKATWK